MSSSKHKNQKPIYRAGKKKRKHSKVVSAPTRRRKDKRYSGR